MFYGEYARVNDGLTGTDFFGGLVLDSSATMWGIGIVQHIDAAAMEVFLSYKQFSGELTDNAGGVHTHNFNDFNVVLGGARIRF